MSRVFDDALLQRAAREAARALAEGDPDTLAGRFSPHPHEPQPATPAEPSRQRAAGSVSPRGIARKVHGETLPKDAPKTATSAPCAAPSSAA